MLQYIKILMAVGVILGAASPVMAQENCTGLHKKACKHTQNCEWDGTSCQFFVGPDLK